MTARPWPRVRKARRSSTVGCGHYVLTGQLIVCRDGRWTCLQCALDHIRETRTKKADHCEPQATPARQ